MHEIQTEVLTCCHRIPMENAKLSFICILKPATYRLASDYLMVRLLFLYIVSELTPPCRLCKLYMVGVIRHVLQFIDLLKLVAFVSLDVKNY